MGLNAKRDGPGHNQRQMDPSCVGRLDPASLARITEDFLAWLDDGNDGNKPIRQHRKRADTPGPAQRKLNAVRLFAKRLATWGLQPDNLNAKNVKERFARLSLRVSEEALSQLLETADSIARAERAKASWNPKASRKKYRCLTRTAVSAAKLAKEISEIFPPPWKQEQAPIGVLVAGLASFVDGSFTATVLVPHEKVSNHRKADKMLRRTRGSLTERTGRTHWELICDLVWLASGAGAVRPSERSIRRYLEGPNRLRFIENAYWSRHWEDLAIVQRLLPAGNPEPFEIAARGYLTSVD